MIISLKISSHLPKILLPVAAMLKAIFLSSSSHGGTWDSCYSRYPRIGDQESPLDDPQPQFLHQITQILKGTKRCQPLWVREWALHLPCWNHSMGDMLDWRFTGRDQGIFLSSTAENNKSHVRRHRRSKRWKKEEIDMGKSGWLKGSKIIIIK